MRIDERPTGGEQPDNVIPLTSSARSAAREFGAAHDRELLTILFTDLVDSTRLQSELGNAEAARLTELHRQIVREELAKYDAREIEWAGDSCLAVFSKPSDAVVFALRIQRAQRVARETQPRLPLVRVGMHLGEIVVKQRDDGGKKTEDLFGLQVSEAARVMSAARGNQIYCTRAVFDSARGALRGVAIEGVGEVVWVNYGPYLLKGSEDTVELCEVGAADAAMLKAPQLSDKVQPALPESAAQAAGSEMRGRSLPSWALALGGLACLAAGLALAAGWNRAERPPEGATASESLDAAGTRYLKQFEIDIGPAVPLYIQIVSAEIAVSPDGRRVAYTAIIDGVKRLYLRDLSRLQSVALAGTENSWTPFFSPDGKWVGFHVPDNRTGRLMKVSVDGGKPEDICEAFPPVGGTWLEDGTIVFTGQDDELPLDLNPVLAHLFRVNANGGTPHRLTKADGMVTGEWSHAQPSVIYGSDALLFTISTALDRREIALLRLDTGKYETIIEDAFNAQYAAPGYILFMRGDALWAVPFDSKTLQITGEETRVEPDIQANVGTMAKTYGVSASGALVYVPVVPPQETRRRLVWVDHAGIESNLGLGLDAYYNPRVSPDGSRIAVTIIGANDQDLWLHDLDRPFSLSRFTDAEDIETHPIWLPDGRNLIYGGSLKGAYGMWVKRVDGVGEAKQLHATVSTEAPVAVSPDGREILVASDAAKLEWDIGSLEIGDDVDAFLAAGGEQRPLKMLIQTRYSEGNPSFSPDGRWITYASDESGQVYVRPYPNVDDGRWQVSIDGGETPRWSVDGREIYFRQGDKMMAVPVTTDRGFKAGTPRELFEQPYFRAWDGSTQYDLEYPEGTRFLMIKEIPDATSTKLVYVENWTEGLDAGR